MTAQRPEHAPLTAFEVAGNCLLVGGTPLTRIADRVGQTPFYAYDRRILRARVESLRTQLPETVHIDYAIKANPMPAVVQELARLVDGMDVASGRELRVALDAGMPANRLSFAGPGKSQDEIAQAVAAGATLCVESERELRVALRSGEQSGYVPQIAVRINPSFELKSSGMKMGGGPKQFGLDVEQIPELFDEIKGSGAHFRGLHIFSGSQNLSAASLIEAQQKTVELALNLAEKAPGPIQWLNIGGGFGIPYFPGEKPLDLSSIAANLAELSGRVKSSLPQAQIVIELGRYLVGEAGIYVCRVLDRKISRGEVFLITDGGLHHHLAASGNFGQVIRKNYPVAIGNKMNATGAGTASVVGRLCTPLDLLADRMPLAHAEVGDLVVIFQSGAYGRTASPAAFLSHPEPLEILV